MKERTYRYFTGTPLYEFGYGLSYTTFRYSDLVVPGTISSDQALSLSVDLENTGQMDGDEVVQVYIKLPGANVPVPIHALKSFRRVKTVKGEKQTLNFTLSPRELSLINNENQRVVEPGKIEVYVGGCQPSPDAIKEGRVVKADTNITGTVFLID